MSTSQLWKNDRKINCTRARTYHWWASLCTIINKKLVNLLFWTDTKTNYTSRCSDFQKKLIDTITTSNFYLKFKENNENDMSVCYFSCFGPVLFSAHVYGSPQLVARSLAVFVQSKGQNPRRVASQGGFLT